MRAQFFKIIVLIIVLILFSGHFIDATAKKTIKKDSKNCFFKLSKQDDQFFLLDTNNTPFYSIGIGSISAKKGHSPKLGYSEYHQNILEKYGSEEKWANVTYNRLLEWGFNTLAGAGSYIREKDLDYTINLNLANDNWETGTVTDFFSDEWISYVEKRCKNKISNLSNDQKLIGNFLDNELKFGPDWRTLLDIFDTYMKFENTSKGKIRLVDFLKNRYKKIENFNKAWITKLDSFDEILNKKTLGIWPYTKKARKDHNDFLYIVSEQFFKTCYTNIKKYDKNHLILGTRFQSFFTPKKTLEACIDYVDVISVNHYVPNPFVLPLYNIFRKVLDFVKPTDYLQKYHDITKKPVLITEFYFRAHDSGLPNTKPYRFFMPVLLNQRQRALCFEIQTRGFIKKPYIIGYHWFGYCDQPKTGRYDGENSNNGLVDVNDEPYTLLVNKMKVVNAIAKNKVKNYC